MSNLRALIREILAEEIATLRLQYPGARTTECVAIRSNDDLMVFASDLLERAKDPEFVCAFNAGMHQFTLPSVPRRPEPEHKVAAPYTLVASTPAHVLELTKTIITERDVASVSRDQTRIRLGKNSRLTPLASDELRCRGIKIERIQT